jgi:hypothetical protein
MKFDHLLKIINKLNFSPTEGLEKIRQLESRQARKHDEEIRSFQKPVFTVPIQNVEKEENQNARFAARLIPVGDASLKVEWFKDGQLLSKGIFCNLIFRNVKW